LQGSVTWGSGEFLHLLGHTRVARLEFRHHVFNCLVHPLISVNLGVLGHRLKFRIKTWLAPEGGSGLVSFAIAFRAEVSAHARDLRMLLGVEICAAVLFRELAPKGRLQSCKRVFVVIAPLDLILVRVRLICRVRVFRQNVVHGRHGA
jgi:hypothetical protein